MAYATRKDVLDMIQTMRPDFVLDNINEFWLTYAEIKVDALLEDFGKSTPAEDYNSILKYATILFYFENAAKSGQVQANFGDLRSRSAGDYKTEFNTTAPMFFFATGESKLFYGLLGHETWRMEAFHLIRAYLKADFKRRTGKSFVYAKGSSDDTLRGYDWDQEKWKTDDGQYVATWW